MTSRPQLQYTASNKDISFDCILENIGFTDDNIIEYVNKFFTDTKDATECLESLKHNPAVWGSAHIPIVLELICSIWGITTKEELTAIITLPQLYMVMVNKLWARYLKTSESNTQFEIEEVPELTKNLNHDLSKLAELGFSKNENSANSITLRSNSIASRSNLVASRLNSVALSLNSSIIPLMLLKPSSKFPSLVDTSKLLEKYLVGAVVGIVCLLKHPLKNLEAVVVGLTLKLDLNALTAFLIVKEPIPAYVFILFIPFKKVFIKKSTMCIPIEYYLYTEQIVLLIVTKSQTTICCATKC